MTQIPEKIFIQQDSTLSYYCEIFAGAAAAGNVAAAAASGQPDTTIEHVDYRNKLTEIRNIYHQVRKLLEVRSAKDRMTILT